ncbi:GGDEF domain-containing protein, partial [Terrisporobacter sp.]|uniref:GGDEF domain-containing protein n=1 Tax=Terrisporobacter sp. TaxID=1965305 RepID=UPI002612C208
MNKFDHERNIKILEIIVGLKFLYIILASLNIISYYNVDLKGTINLNGSGSLLLLLLFVCFIVPFMVVCSKMIYGYTKKTFLNMPKVYNIIEIAVILGLFIILMSKTGGENSSFKYISMIIILISSIQYKKIISFIIAIAVSLIILSFNFINLILSNNISNIEIINSFEGDIILVSSLLITSFILSLYIEIEKDYNLKLKELAIKDGLTGLYNHRSFQDMLDTSLKKAQKLNKEVSLLLMDIDNFKNFNDINGHQKGDWLLTKLGKMLKDTVGDLGVVTRYGGEEFAVILYDVDKTKASNLGELIRQNIRNTTFPNQEHQPSGNLTVSIGVSSYPTVAKNKKELIELADNALYRAKSFDKDRV